MQINNTTNAHNKSLGFQGVNIHKDVAEIGSDFVKELLKAKPVIEKRYGNKVNINVTRTFEDIGGDYNRVDLAVPEIIVNVKKPISKTRTREKALPQTWKDVLLGRPVKFTEEKYVDKIELSASKIGQISPEMKCQRIITSISKLVEEARRDLHQDLTQKYDLRKAKRILGVETSLKKPEIYIDDSHFPL
ncbi:MAG: hypothetical protein A2039_02580 [Candidatus Melainabacteria bacterium GWA2_34_9]|nr:MAG: hypothetical protein A2039_02580 [Candidatus Melainabacteria bacterium GWA2_34_9]